MGNISLIIKDIKSLFFKENLVFLWNLGTACEKKASLGIKKNLNISVQDMQSLYSIASCVISFHYEMIIILYTFKEERGDAQKIGVTCSRSSSWQEAQREISRRCTCILEPSAFH